MEGENLKLQQLTMELGKRMSVHCFLRLCYFQHWCRHWQTKKQNWKFKLRLRISNGAYIPWKLMAKVCHEMPCNTKAEVSELNSPTSDIFPSPNVLLVYKENNFCFERDWGIQTMLLSKKNKKLNIKLSEEDPCWNFQIHIPWCWKEGS